MKKTLILLALAALILTLHIPVYAHPGRTDSKGGHMNHSTGEYHYHHGEEAHPHFDIDENGTVDCPLTYGTDNKRSITPMGVAVAVCVACPLVGVALSKSNTKK